MRPLAPAREAARESPLSPHVIPIVVRRLTVHARRSGTSEYFWTNMQK
jgi:hypothetical protein